MQEVKAIIIANKIDEKNIVKKYNLKDKENLEDFFIYVNDKFVFYFYEFKNEVCEKIFLHIKQNYVYEEIISIGEGEIFSNFDLKSGDVILPNTFLLLNTETPLFLDTMNGENYDLTKFGLTVNGICTSLRKDEKIEGFENYSDITDDSSYFILEKFNKILDTQNIVFIRYMKSSDNEVIINALNIMDLIIG